MVGPGYWQDHSWSHRGQWTIQSGEIISTFIAPLKLKLNWVLQRASDTNRTNFGFPAAHWAAYSLGTTSWWDWTSHCMFLNRVLYFNVFLLILCRLLLINVLRKWMQMLALQWRHLCTSATVQCYLIDYWHSFNQISLNAQSIYIFRT